MLASEVIFENDPRSGLCKTGKVQEGDNVGSDSYLRNPPRRRSWWRVKLERAVITREAEKTKYKLREEGQTYTFHQN